MANSPLAVMTRPGSVAKIALNSWAYVDQQVNAFEARDRIAAVADRLIEIARSRGIGQGPAGLTVREVSGNRDLGLATDNWVSAALAAGAWNNYINSALANNRAVGFYGVSCRDAVVTSVRVRFQSAGGGTTFKDVDVAPMYASLNQIMYLDSPVFYGPTDTVFVQLYGVAVLASNFQLHGLIVEPAGLYISQNIV